MRNGIPRLRRPRHLRLSRSTRQTNFIAFLAEAADSSEEVLDLLRCNKPETIAALTDIDNL